ncbi:MAG: hypothetical protein ABI405_09700 [Parafilimonas sp.]
MEEVTICKCFHGGYDLCICDGSGVIIKHELFDSYIPSSNAIKPIKRIEEKIKLNIEDKLQLCIKQDNDIILFIDKSGNRRSREKAIKILSSKVLKWYEIMHLIKSDELKADIAEYIKELKQSIEFRKRHNKKVKILFNRHAKKIIIRKRSC